LIEDNDVQVTLEKSSTTTLDFAKTKPIQKRIECAFVVHNTRYAFIASLLSKNFEQHRRRIAVGK
jgi:hypothetical protein